MTIYAIKAYEQTYGGLHGVYDIHVEDYESLESAESDGETMSYEVMESYSDIEESIAAEAEEYPEDEREDAYADLKRENVAYEIWELLPDYHFTISELDEMLFEDWEGTIESYFKIAG